MQQLETPTEAWERLTGLAAEQALDPDESTESVLCATIAYFEEMFSQPIPEADLALLARYIEANCLRATIEPLARAGGLSGDRRQNMPSEIIDEVVDQASSTGIKVNQVWYNLTKAQQAEHFALPHRGDSIRLSYHVYDTPDGKSLRFIDDWRPLNGSPEPQIDPETALPPMEIHAASWLPDVEPVNTRLTCLNAAIQTHAQLFSQNMSASDSDLSRAEIEASLVGLAERYVAWVTWGGHGVA